MSDMSSAMAGLPPGMRNRPCAARGADRWSGRQWAAIHDAAEAVARIAGIEPGDPCSKSRGFEAIVRDMDGARRALIENSVGDMVAFLQPGLKALLVSMARGQDAGYAAEVLWQEFRRSRDEVLELLPEPGRMDPRRAA